MLSYINKYVVGIVFAGILVSWYIYLHYNRYCNIELGNIPYALLVSAIGIVLYSTVLAHVTQLDNLGDLKDEKSTIILGFAFIVYFTGYEIVSTFFDIFKVPIQAYG
jgi:hypothetical protein